jgi:hypothetical protein
MPKVIIVCYQIQIHIKREDVEYSRQQSKAGCRRSCLQARYSLARNSGPVRHL